MSNKETSKEIASLAGEVLNWDEPDVLFAPLKFLELAKRLAGSCLSQYEQDENFDS